MDACFPFSKPNVSNVPARNFCPFMQTSAQSGIKLFQMDILLHTAYFGKETETDVM
jgi:hypothetical protein